MNSIKRLYTSDGGDTTSDYSVVVDNCSLPIDSDTASSIKLKDGRRLGYAQHGMQTGKAVFLIHGLPGSRIDGAWFHNDAKQLGLRIITVERPGYGLSSPSPKRKISDHADEIRQLAAYLKLEEYGIVGASAGGPYALACALLLPAKIVTVVCGSGPPQSPTQGMMWTNWLGLKITPYFPGVAKRFYRMQPSGRTDLSREKRFALARKSNLINMNGKDSAFYTNDALLMQLRTGEEAFAQGFDGVMLENQLLASDWDFDMKQIRTPVDLWYGTEDEHVPWHQGQYIADLLAVELRLLPDTHVGVIIRQRRQWLAQIAERMASI